MNAREFTSIRGEELRVRRSESGHLVLERLGLGEWCGVSPSQYTPSLLAELLAGTCELSAAVDERIDAAIDSLLRLAQDDGDSDLASVVGLVRSMWAANQLPALVRETAELRAIWEGGVTAAPKE